MTEPSSLRSTRAAYDATASDYAEHFRTELAASTAAAVCDPGRRVVIMDAAIV
ncbi:MAG: hypothetical protein LC749_19000 [Actinobacteria bacterium]|nr:hypothetical protein [Actinomycetota bacterium]